MRADEVLAGTYLFRDLPQERLNDYARRARFRRYPRGTYLIREGDPSDDIYILASGSVKGSRLGRDGGELVDIVVWRPGEIFGEPGALTSGAKRIMDGLALEDTECYLLNREDLLQMLEQDPLLMRRMLERLAVMTRERALLLSSVAFLDVAGRVAAKLLDLVRTHGEETEGGIRIDMKMSQSMLAGMVLASRESVNRALATLIAEGAVTQSSGTIIVQRPELLRRRVGQGDGVR